jgi:DNA repair protein RecO (recombination protein O)
MVLSAMPIGEYDKRLVILTKEIGKISVFAKGARRPNSALLACSQPFTFGEFSLYAGRTSYNIVAAEIKNYFEELREDFEGLCYGFYFCEFSEYITKENNDEKDILKLLYQSLRALSKRTINPQLIKVIFELKIITLNGEAPQVFECVKCGNKASHSENDSAANDTEKHYFSAANGGVLCTACSMLDKSAVVINTSTLYAMQYIIAKEIEKLYTFTVSPQVLIQLQNCIGKYLSHYNDHEFKSLEMLKSFS